MDETAKDDLNVLILAVIPYRHENSCPATAPLDGCCKCTAYQRNRSLEQAIHRLKYSAFRTKT